MNIILHNVLKTNDLKKLLFILLSFFFGFSAFSQCSVDLGDDVTFCWNGPAVDLAANITVQTPGGNPHILVWDNGIGPDFNPLVSPLVTTTYEVTMSDGLGCSTTDQITVTVSHPIANAGPDIFMCQENPGQLTGNSGPGGTILGTVLYNWQNNVVDNSAQNPIVDVNGNTVISLVIVDIISFFPSITCTSEPDLVNVIVFNTPNVNAGADMIECANSLPEVFNIPDGTPGGGTWSGADIIADGTFTPTTEGQTTLTYTYVNGNGCTNNDDLVIDISEAVTVNVGADFGLCQNAPDVQLFMQTGTWSGSPFVTAGGLFSPTTPGIYNLTYTEIDGPCTSTDDIIITVYNLPNANAGPDFTICESVLTQINGIVTLGDNPIDTYLWQGGNINGADNNFNVVFDPAVQTTYTFTVTDTEGCSSTDEAIISINPLPTVDAGTDISICNMDPAQTVNLNGTPIAGGGETGEWTGNSVTTAGVFTDPGVGTYVMTYTFVDANGCTDSDDMEIVVVSPNNANQGADEEICLNDGTLQLQQPGIWSGTDVTANGVFTPTTEGVFTLDFETVIGICTVQGQLDVTVLGLPTADAGSDLDLCLGATTQLAGGGNTPNTIIDTYLWSGGLNIDDVTIADPNVNPTTDQVYTLTVTDDKGCTAQDNVDVTILSLPIVNAGVDIELCNQAIVETLTGFSPAGGSWSGAGITNPTGEYTPAGEGIFNVTYTYTDPATTCTNTDIVEITVVAPENIDAGNPNSVCEIYPALTLSGFTPVNDVTWTGPGITDPSGVFDPGVTGVGVFSVTISYGTGTCFVQDSKDITVLAVEPVDAGIDESVCLDAAAFNLSGMDPVGGTWIGSGITDPANGTFDPATGVGAYVLIYSYVHPVTGCVNTDAKTINVLELPVADFTVSADQCQDAAIDLANTSTGATIFNWDFGNGDLSNDQNPVYTYTNSGTYTLELVVSNAGGCTSTTTTLINVVEIAEANFTVSQLSGCESIDVDFVNTSSGDNLTFVWDFDNGGANNTDVTPPTTTFTDNNNNTETYTVTLDATNSCGTDQATINIMVNPLPVASFTTDATEYCATSVSVTNTSVGEPTGFDWDFGGLGTSILENPPAFDYTMGVNSIDYIISLEVTNACGVDTDQITITILPAALTAGFTTDVVDGCAPLTVNVTDQSGGATVYNYDFGDTGSIANVESPTYVYNTPGTYVLNQELENLCSTDVESLTITVYSSPAMAFSSSNTSFCDGQAVQFNNDTPDLENINWDFGDTNTSTDADTDNTYLAPGSYDVTLSGTSIANSCPGTITENITIYSTPITNFNPSTILGCSPLLVDLQNITTGVNTSDWDFGDGAISDLTSPSHTYINLTLVPQLYDVVLVSTSGDNCVSTYQTSITVNPSPQIDYELSSYEACDYPATVSVTNNTVGATSYSWSITTQGTTQDTEPTVTFISPGNYDFSLVAQNEFTCISQETQEYVVHSKPVVNYLSDIESGCSNLEVEFFNQTVGASNFEWDFGDGSFSFDESPIHIYLNPGEYQVRLKATNSDGCQDSIANNGMIQVYESPLADFTFTPEEIDIFDPTVTFTDASEDVQFWNWDFGDGEGSTLTSPEHIYEHPGNYVILLSVMNEFGCIDQKIEEIEITSDLIVFVPNAFSPNADGFNDLFTPSLLGKEFTSHYEFKIYNRWGEIIFQTEDPVQGWRGDAYGGEHYVPEGNYSWSLEFKLTTEVDKVVQTGSVYLFR